MLEPGTSAVVSASEGTGLGKTSNGDFCPLLPAGVKVTVGHDPGEFVDDMEKSHKVGTKNSGLRHVKVTVESGEHRGVSGEVRREDLRPAK